MCRTGILLCVSLFIFGCFAVICSSEGVHHAASRLRSHKPSRRHRAIADGALRFEPTPFSRKMLELKSAGKVHCRVAGGTSPVVQWFLNNEDPLPDGAQSVNGTLLIPEVQDIHKGTYTCQAKDGDKVIATKISVDVVVSPHIVEPQQNQQLHVAINSDVWLHCVAAGDPPPALTWDRNLTDLHAEKEGVVLEGDKNASHARIVVYSNGSLLLRNISPSQADRYGCVAGNVGGLDRRELYLHVHPEGELPSEPSSGSNKAIIVSVCVAAAYMVLVLALMLYCRRRRRERGEKIEIEMAEGREKLVEEEDVKKVGNGSAQNGRLLVQDRDSGADNSDSCVSRASKKSALLDQLTLPRSFLTEQITLGRGEFGDVLLAKIDMGQLKKLRGKETDTADMRPVLVKVLNTKDEGQLLEFRRQLDLFSKVRHENVVRLLGLCNEMDPHYAVFDHTDWGDLKHFLIATRTAEERAEYAARVGATAAAETRPPARASSRPGSSAAPLLPAHAALLATQLARAAAAIAHKRMTHRDIAARNCLITSKLQLKLSLPGLTRGPHAHEYYKLHDQVIPLRWLPLEALEGEHSAKTDAYMLAATVWEIYTKAELPFAKLNDNSVIERLRNGTLEWTVPGSVPARLTELLKKCWSKSPSARPQLDAIAEELSAILQEVTSESDKVTSRDSTEGAPVDVV